MLKLLKLSLFCIIFQNTLAAKRPNILLVLTDDQSYPHIRALGCDFVNTPAMDGLLREGVQCTNAHAAAPQCGPSRAAMLTGKYCWRLKEGGVHGGIPLETEVSLPQVLEQQGYHCGYVGKGSQPDNWVYGNRDQAFSGHEYAAQNVDDHFLWVYSSDYFRNFKDFYAQKKSEQPFFFFLSAFEPHRDFRNGGGRLLGKKLEDAQVPGFLPDVPDVRDDILDYGSRIDYADQHLYQTIEFLRKNGELENTIIIFSSDNGMAMPGAKATLYDYGTHMPLIFHYPKQFAANKTIKAPVSLVDIFPTLMDILEIDFKPKDGFSGISLYKYLKDPSLEPERKAIYTYRERHAMSRWLNLGYPQRAIITEKYLYIYNFHPEREFAGSSKAILTNGDTIQYGRRSLREFYGVSTVLGENRFIPEEAKKQYYFKWHNMLLDTYNDIDHSATKTYMIEHRDDPALKVLWEHSFGMQPQEQLFDITKDPYCLTNLANQKELIQTKEKLNKELMAYLKNSVDPRVNNPNPDIQDTYISPIKVQDVVFPKEDWAVKDPKLSAKYEKMMLDKTLPDKYVTSTFTVKTDTLFYRTWRLIKEKNATWKQKEKIKLYDLRYDPTLKNDLASREKKAFESFVQIAKKQNSK